MVFSKVAYCVFYRLATAYFAYIALCVIRLFTIYKKILEMPARLQTVEHDFLVIGGILCVEGKS